MMSVPSMVGSGVYYTATYVLIRISWRMYMSTLVQLDIVHIDKT